MKGLMPLLALVVMVASATSRVCDIAPYKCYKGWTAGGPNSYVGQQFVARADSLVYAEFFAAVT